MQVALYFVETWNAIENKLVGCPSGLGSVGSIDLLACSGTYAHNWVAGTVRPYRILWGYSLHPFQSLVPYRCLLNFFIGF